MAENLPTKDKIIGTSLNNLKELVVQYAGQGKNILLLGPSGSGKGLFAKLYQESTGRNKLIPINCSGIGDSNLISELFGHQKGSFTGATEDRKGLLSTYGEKEVIFFDELGDALQHFQASLLRVLETGDYKPFGSDKVKKLNSDEMRIIAATTRPDNIREELKHRFTTLNVPGLLVLIKFGNLPELIKSFCQDSEVDYISEIAFELLKEYSWPGNVRELKRAFKDAILLCKIRNSKIIQIDDLPTLNKDPYSMNYIDKSKTIKISELSSKSKALSHSFFFNPWEVIKEEPSIPMKNEDTEMLRSMLDSINSSISNGFRGIKKSIDEFSHSESELHPIKRIDFENTIPEEYNKRFYEHWAKADCGPTKLSKRFNGKIGLSAASVNLKKAKKRLDEPPEEKSNNQEDFP